MIDPIRQIRRDIGERTGHDLDRLFDKLRSLVVQYAQRQAIFRGVSQEAAERVEASWGEFGGAGSDPLIGELRARRSGGRPAQG